MINSVSPRDVIFHVTIIVTFEMNCAALCGTAEFYVIFIYEARSVLRKIDKKGRDEEILSFLPSLKMVEQVMTSHSD